MKNIKLFCLFTLTALAVNFSSQPAWSDAASAAADQDQCIVNPATVVAPKVHPKKKYVHLHTTPTTKARAHALARMHHQRNLPVAINICPPEPKKITLAKISLCRAALGNSANMTAPEVEAMLVAGGYDTTQQSLGPAMVRAMQAHPDAAPALYAYALQHANPADPNAIPNLSAAAYHAAPGQAAGLAYGGVAANPDQGSAISQSLLAVATPQDSDAIRQCALDANPDIRTAAFVPALAPQVSAIGQNDIRNNIDNAVGIQTLVPGLEAREKDDSAT